MWKQVHSCQQLMAALRKADLTRLAPAVVGDYFPEGSPRQLAQKTRVCEGARPQAHYHFFDQNGRFGSLDQNGEQVDENTYRIVNDHSFRIGKGQFRYHILNGKTLMLEPVIPEAERRRALANPLKFTPAGWQVTVAYEGVPWKRVDCAGWC